VVEVRPTDWPENFFLTNQRGGLARLSCRLNSYTKWFSSSIELVAWPVQWEDSREEFQNKELTKERTLQTVPWELKIEAIFGGFIEGIS